MCEKNFKTEKGFINHMRNHEVITQLDGEGETLEEDTKAAKDSVITTVTFTPDCQADWNDKVVTDIVVKRIKAVGLEIVDLTIFRNKTKAFTSCAAKIHPVKSTFCEGISFPFNGKWTWEFG